MCVSTAGEGAGKEDRARWFSVVLLCERTSDGHKLKYSRVCLSRKSSKGD